MNSRKISLIDFASEVVFFVYNNYSPFMKSICLQTGMQTTILPVLENE